MHNKSCDVLGDFCWTHQTHTASGLPGWNKQARSDSFVQRPVWEVTTDSIVWANGNTEDPKRSRSCVLCANTVCPHPVFDGVEYDERVTKKSYWNWLEGNATEDAETGCLREPVAANPDELEG